MWIVIRQRQQDYELAVKCSILSVYAMSEDWLVDSCRATELKYKSSNPPKTPQFAYLYGVLRSKAAKAGKKFETLLASCPVQDDFYDGVLFELER